MTSDAALSNVRVTRGQPLIGNASLPITAAAIVAGAVLISLCAQVSIPLGFTPVPLTGQTFAVLLVGASLGSWAGAASVILYVIAGGLGLPVYASHAHGWSVVTSASGGYLLGFIGAAALTGALAEHRWDRRFSSSLAALLCGSVLIYVCGVAWLAHVLHLNTQSALEDGLYPFIVGDLIKLYLAAAALPTAWKLLERRR